MFEKLKSKLKNFQPDEGDKDTRGQLIGLFILIFLLVLAYSVGHGDGRQSAQSEIPQLKLVSEKIDRIEKAMLENRACANSLIETSRSDQVQP